MYWALGVAIGFGPVLDTPAVIALFQCGTEWPNCLMRSTGKLGVHFDTFLVINMTRVWCTCSTECISATSFASAFVVTCRRILGKLLSNKPKQTQRISRLLSLPRAGCTPASCSPQQAMLSTWVGSHWNRGYPSTHLWPIII